jgi:hypothetical protein
MRQAESASDQLTGAAPTGALAASAGLRSWLRELDRLLSVATAQARLAFGPEAALDPYRGLYVSDGDVSRLLAWTPGASPWWSDDHEPPELPRPAGDLPTLTRLERAFGLSAFDSAVILIALAPELDLRYRRLYGYLQDDVTMRRPTVDLALSLLCRTPDARLRRRAHFSSGAPLVRHGLLRPLEEQPGASLLASVLQLDAQVERLFTGDQDLDRRLVGAAELTGTGPSGSTVEPLLPESTRNGLLALVDRAAVGEALDLELQGPLGSEHARVARWVAGSLGRPLLSADLGGAEPAGGSLEGLLRLLVREAWLLDAVLHVRAVPGGGDQTRRLLDAALAGFPAELPAIILSTERQARWWPATGPRVARIPVPLPAPDAGRRRALWAAALDAAHVPSAGIDLDILAARFRFGPDQITAAVEGARGARRWRAAARGRPARARAHARPATGDLLAAARAQSRLELGDLARKVEAPWSWRDIVLPDDVLAQLREFCGQVAKRERVLAGWEFDRRLGQGIGPAALFAGPSGTGKTMAAAIVARELALDCYKVDLAGVVSKYVGETEKNLSRIFEAAEAVDVVLLFDECEALFGKRSEVRDAHDRYANIEISYLLQRMEARAGPTILATNLQAHLDEAFTRRLAFTVPFPFPAAPERRRIWAGIWPARMPLAADVDFSDLARRFRLSGGSIRNAAMASAFLAAADGGTVTMGHVLHAVRREYQKLGGVPADLDEAGPIDG